MAEENESHVAPFDGAGALDVSYKNKMMRSVLFIDRRSEIGQGSGSIVELPFLPPMLLTCNHVIPSKDVAGECSIYFDRDNHEKPGVEVLGKDLFDLDGKDGFITNEALGYTIIIMRPNKIPGEAREPFLLDQYQRLDKYHLKKNDNVSLVHYPRMDGSFVRHESSYTVQILNGYIVGHIAETHGGSAGCPVLKEVRNQWVLVGVHRGMTLEESRNPRINVAIHVEAVHRTMNGMPNPLGDHNLGPIWKEYSNPEPRNGKEEKAQQDSLHTEVKSSKSDMGDNQPDGAIQVTEPTSTIQEPGKGKSKRTAQQDSRHTQVEKPGKGKNKRTAQQDSRHTQVESIKGNRKRSSCHQSGSSKQKKKQSSGDSEEPGIERNRKRPSDHQYGSPSSKKNQSSEDSEEPDVLKEEIINNKDYKEILRIRVANHIDDHLDELSDFLNVKSGAFKNDHRRTENAAAALLKFWAERDTDGKTPIWSDLLEAMKKSGMTKEARALDKFLTKGSS